jgi:hypothetical protein
MKFVNDIFDVWDDEGKHLAGVIVPAGTSIGQVKQELVASGEFGARFAIKRCAVGDDDVDPSDRIDEAEYRMDDR